MNAVRVVAAAAVTALGPLDRLWERLLAGESGIAPVERFPVAAWPAKSAACIPGLAAPPGRTLLLPLLERLAAALGPVPGDCRLLTATTKGGIDQLENVARDRPARRADVPLGGVPALAGALFGIARPGVNVSAACASSTIALARGAALVASGREDAVLVCAADLVSEFVFSGFAALQALSPFPCRPFDRTRAGLSLGEGAAALLLMSAERARAEGRAPLGDIIGWGVANDANHVTAPARDACGLIQAVRGACSRAGVRPREIAGISAHGTGTVFNDLMEITAHEAVFRGLDVPLSSVKGAIGHTLGAAGAIETALALRALEAGVLPPTVGLREPEERAARLVSNRPRKIAGDTMLVTNSGFGGINAALVVRRGAGA